MLERLIKRVIERIQIREKTVLSIGCKETKSNDERLFLEAKTIRIKGVDRVFLDLLLSGEKNETQEWTDRAHSYGVEIQLELFDTGEPWLCYDQIAKVGYPIFLANGKRLVHISENVICFRDVALLESGSTLCKYKNQIMTSLAREELQKKQIDIQERV